MMGGQEPADDFSEEEFGNEIPEEEAEKLQTVGSVIEYIDSKA